MTLPAAASSLIRADALHLPLADGVVDLIVTSPPYFALRSYTDGGEHYDGQIGSEATPAAFLEALWAVTAECRRVLKPSGSMFVNLGDKYAGSGGHNNAGISKRNLPGQSAKAANRAAYLPAARRDAPDRYNQNSDGVPAKSLMGLPWRYALGCVDQLGLVLRAEIIWSKPNGMPESATDRVRRSHEQWFHFTRSGHYFAALDEVREPHTQASLERYAYSDDTWTGSYVDHAKAGVEGQHRRKNPLGNPLGKPPGSVWSIAAEPLIVPEHIGVDHFAAFPQEWPRRLILGWSPSGICIVCGEGRRPVVDTEQVKSPVHGDGSIMGNRNGGSDERQWDGLPRFNVERTITGYACACPDTMAPIRPAVVLDPFGGTGTVAMVARTLGRFPVHVDLSADYLRLARWRIFESGHATKTEARTNHERQGTLL